MAIEARVLFRSQAGRVLLLQRADSDAWDLPAAVVRDGEDAEVAALRGALEATGYRAGYVHGMHCRTLVGGRVTAVYLRAVEDEFAPRLSQGFVSFMWADPAKVLERKARRA
jgi:8-oxo-dGTP pyrophosphatase MutT (NUDIX family)